jgi:Carboxypeptidase regulatory-like domain
VFIVHTFGRSSRVRYSRFAILLFAVVAWHAAPAQAVGAIRGRVVDQSGRVVENAQVVLTPSSRRAITLDDGRFAITDVPQGVYVLSARRIGYEPIDLTVAVSDSTAPLTVTLVAIPEELDAIRIREKSTGIRYSGVVLDQYDAPVADAEVVAIGIDSHLRTDIMGRFMVPKLGKGTLTLRIRKIGYSAYFESFRILAERADTIRMLRLAESLPAVEINEQSGFGNGAWVYRELDQRMRYKSVLAGAISREELADQGTLNLCDALPRTPSGNRYVFISPSACHNQMYRVLVDGTECHWRRLTDFTADRIEMVESHPKVADPRCPQQPTKPPEFFAIWTRRDAPKPAPIRAVTEAAKPAVATADRSVRLPLVEVRAAVPSLGAAHLQGQVVDSAGHPVRSAILYTMDPPRATLSDKNGYFRLPDMQSGPVTLEVVRNGFVGIDVELRLPPDSTVAIGVKLFRARPAFGSFSVDSGGGAEDAPQGRKVRIVSVDGTPIMYANVVVDGAATRLTDEKGEISLGVGKRQSFTLRVSRIGFAPWYGTLALPANFVMTVTLPRIALAAVTITGEPVTSSALVHTGFYDRWMMREKGVLSADFIGPEEIESRHPDRITNMLRGLNGVCLAQRKGGSITSASFLYAYSTQSASPVIGGGSCPSCPMAIVIDGMQQTPAPAIDEVLDANDVAAIEVYARGGNTPISMQFDDTKCGVIALWTGGRR